MVIDKSLKFKKGIYLLTIGQHKYVGSSINLYQRLKTHFFMGKANKHDNKYLQRCINKYGIDLLSYTILEICNKNISKIDLLAREKYFIEITRADLNLKLDPVTQQQCSTTIRSVYQFDQFGTFLKKWNSLTEAAKFYNIHASNITKVCSNPKKQRLAAGFLWSYKETYDYPLKCIYVFDLKGNLLSKHKNTIEIYKQYFPTIDRKTVLSQLKSKIDKQIPYKFIYLSSVNSIQINKQFENNSLYSILRKNNPLIRLFKENMLIRERYYLDYAAPTLLINKLKDIKNIEKLDIIDIQMEYKKIPIKVINLQTKKEKIYNSLDVAVYNTFGNLQNYKNIFKHYKKNTPYKNFLFGISEIKKSSELLESLEGVKTKTELETINGNV